MLHKLIQIHKFKANTPNHKMSAKISEPINQRILSNNYKIDCEDFLERHWKRFAICSIFVFVLIVLDIMVCTILVRVGLVATHKHVDVLHSVKMTNDADLKLLMSASVQMGSFTEMHTEMMGWSILTMWFGVMSYFSMYVNVKYAIIAATPFLMIWFVYKSSQHEHTNLMISIQKGIRESKVTKTWVRWLFGG